MKGNATGDRPDPRLAASWCREGVAHDHDACGRLWNPQDQRDIEAAARWADDRAEERRTVLRRAAERLRSPYLCNWDARVAAALAAWLESAGTDDRHAVATAEALLTSFGDRPAGGTVSLPGPAGTSGTLPADDVRALVGYLEERPYQT